MNIIFICGSLEPGRDGVGDYTRRLAEALTRNGHLAAMIALNDQHIASRFEGFQQSGNIDIRTLRLPKAWQDAERCSLAEKWIADIDPEWLSLQYVPFAFHPKGLALGLGKQLATIGAGKRWHIMAHELWVGMDKESSKKFIVWGWVQKQLIKSLFARLSPVVLHTHTGLYMRLLEKTGCAPRHLPLFGNIPVASNCASTTKASGEISFVVFGGIHAGALIGSLAGELKEYQAANNVNIVLKMVGRCGNEQSRWQQEWESAGLTVKIYGEQEPRDISAILSASSFGLSSTPASLMEKSGSVAAMLEHGLIVLCIARPWHPREIPGQELPQGVVQYQHGQISNLLRSEARQASANRITDIATQFVKNLTEINGQS